MEKIIKKNFIKSKLTEMRSQVDSCSMLICSKYVKCISDMINITLVNSKFKENIDKLHFNPFKINSKSRKYFIRLQTQWLFDRNDEIFSDGDISGYYVNFEVSYGVYLTMEKRYQNIKFRRIIYTKNDRKKYGNEIPFVVKKLDDKVFFKSNIKEIKIPDSIVEIGNYCFRNCTSLTSITISSRLTKIGYYAFSYCNSLTSITLPNSVNLLREHCFDECSSLTSIQIPNSVSVLCEWCFCGCSSLTSIETPTSVTRIGKNCFYDCTSLTRIKARYPIIVLESKCFYHCPSLISLSIRGAVLGNCKYIANNVLGQLGEVLSIYSLKTFKVSIPKIKFEYENEHFDPWPYGLLEYIELTTSGELSGSAVGSVIEKLEKIQSLKSIKISNRYGDFKIIFLD